MNSTKGFSITLAIGKYGGFHTQFTTWTWRICLGWIAFTIYWRTDIEAFIEAIKHKYQ